MKCGDVIQTIEPWLARHRRSAWKPIVEEGDGPATVSKFCGTPWISSNAPWPDCAHCKKPLQLFLQLDLNNLPEKVGQQFGAGLLQLVYCIREECKGYGGWEPFAVDLSRVRIVEPIHPSDSASPPPDDSFPARRIVRWERLDDLPDPQEHDELGLKYTYNFDEGTLRLECPELHFDITNRMNECPAEAIAASEIGDKLAGWPNWVQGVEYPRCPKCGKRMIQCFSTGLRG
jgi:uncharacterized protein YwqG